MEISSETKNAINSLSFQINYEFRQVENEVDAKFILVENMRVTTIVMFAAQYSIRVQYRMDCSQLFALAFQRNFSL